VGDLLIRAGCSRTSRRKHGFRQTIRCGRSARFVRDVLEELNRSLSRLYASEGRPSIPPEQLLSEPLLQVFYGIRSERQLMEQLDYNLLYRWFVGLSPDDPVWDPSVFTKDRDRLQSGEVFAKFMSKLIGDDAAILAHQPNCRTT
jgi:transposase